jgi:hypothetical protein
VSTLFFFFLVLGFEFRALCLLRCALPLESHLQPFLLEVIFQIGSPFFSEAGLR